MTKEQRAEALMRQGPIQNVRRIMELEEAARLVLEDSFLTPPFSRERIESIVANRDALGAVLSETA